MFSVNDPKTRSQLFQSIQTNSAVRNANPNANHANNQISRDELSLFIDDMNNQLDSPQGISPFKIFTVVNQRSEAKALLNDFDAIDRYGASNLGGIAGDNLIDLREWNGFAKPENSTALPPYIALGFKPSKTKVDDTSFSNTNELPPSNFSMNSFFKVLQSMFPESKGSNRDVEDGEIPIADYPLWNPLGGNKEFSQGKIKFPGIKAGIRQFEEDEIPIVDQPLWNPLGSYNSFSPKTMEFPKGDIKFPSFLGFNSFA